MPQDIPQLDALTGGVFSAATSGERAQRVRQWLAAQPEAEQVQVVYKALNAKDKGAAKPLREHLDELRRSKEQETVAADWANRAQTLLAATRLNIADAMAWQRDAARAGAPLSREPLSQLKTQLVERVKGIEDLQHRVQVQREAAVLLAQRIETLSTKPWREADAASDALAQDVSVWQVQADALLADPHWPSVDLRLPPQLDTSRGQLALVWEAFGAALAQARLAAADAAVALPLVPVWADELRQARGLPAEAGAPAQPQVDPQVREQAQMAVQETLTRLEQEIGEGHGKASSGAAAALRQALKEHGRHIDATLDSRAHAALAAAGELEGWQRWRADQLREELVAKAEALLARPQGQALGGRKMQETLRQLRAQWKQIDQGGVSNHALWKRFDHACNEAHKVVDAWLEKARAEAAAVKARRQVLIDELLAYKPADDQPTVAWRELSRALHEFDERWRTAGHLGEKAFAEWDARWKAALQAAWAPLKAAQAESVQRRQAMIDEARALGDEPALRIDAVKALQQRWQAEAQTVPLDRRHEQKLWDAFRQPIDAAFQRKSTQREKAQQSTSARDRRVLAAAQTLREANASGDARAIREAMQQLQTALHEVQPDTPSDAPPLAATASEVATGEVTGAAEMPTEDGTETSVPAPTPVPTPAPARKPVVAVRGDDRPGKQGVGDARGKAPLAGAPGTRHGHTRHDGARPQAAGRMARDRFDRGHADRPRMDRAPTERLGDAAFRAQRDALDQAQLALKKLAAQAHGEAVAHVLAAWEKRDPAALPATQELGARVSSAVRTAWSKALQGRAHGAADSADQTLLRLEMAANLPSPVTELEARRALQLQLLTQRHRPAPEQTWADDVAQVLSSVYDPARGRRLQQILRGLLQR